MALDLILCNARIAASEAATVDIAIAGGRIVDVGRDIAADAPAEDIDGKLVVAGFVETHIHLDKSCILDRCQSREERLQKRSPKLPQPSALSPRMTFISVLAARWNGRSCRAPRACEPMSRSTHASGSKDSAPSGGSSRTTPGRSTSKS